MVPFRYEKFLEDLTYLVESNEIPLSRIDDAVERILRVKFLAGLFEHPYTDRSLLDTVGCKVGFHRNVFSLDSSNLNMYMDVFSSQNNALFILLYQGAFQFFYTNETEAPSYIM